MLLLIDDPDDAISDVEQEYPSVKGCNHGMGGANGTLLCFLLLHILIYLCPTPFTPLH